MTHLTVATGPQTLQSVVVGQVTGPTTKPLGTLGPKLPPRAPELKPSCVLQTLGPITHIAGLKGPPRPPFAPASVGQQVKVLASGDPQPVPTTVISSASLLIHNTLNGKKV